MKHLILIFTLFLQANLFARTIIVQKDTPYLLSKLTKKLYYKKLSKLSLKAKQRFARVKMKQIICLNIESIKDWSYIAPGSKISIPNKTGKIACRKAGEAGQIYDKYVEYINQTKQDRQKKKLSKAIKQKKQVITKKRKRKRKVKKVKKVMAQKREEKPKNLKSGFFVDLALGVGNSKVDDQYDSVSTISSTTSTMGAHIDSWFNFDDNYIYLNILYALESNADVDLDPMSEIELGYGKWFASDLSYFFGVNRYKISLPSVNKDRSYSSKTNLLQSLKNTDLILYNVMGGLKYRTKLLSRDFSIEASIQRSFMGSVEISQENYSKDLSSFSFNGRAKLFLSDKKTYFISGNGGYYLMSDAFDIFFMYGMVNFGRTF